MSSSKRLRQTLVHSCESSFGLLASLVPDTLAYAASPSPLCHHLCPTHDVCTSTAHYPCTVCMVSVWQRLPCTLPLYLHCLPLPAPPSTLLPPSPCHHSSVQLPLPLLPLPQAVTLSLALSLCTIILVLSAPVASFSAPATRCSLSTPPSPSVPSPSPSPSFTPCSLPRGYPTLSPHGNLATCSHRLAVCLQHPAVYPCRLRLPPLTPSAFTLSVCTLATALSTLFYPRLPCSLSCGHPAVCSCRHLAVCTRRPAVCPCCLC